MSYKNGTIFIWSNGKDNIEIVYASQTYDRQDVITMLNRGRNALDRSFPRCKVLGHVRFDDITWLDLKGSAAFLTVAEWVAIAIPHFIGSDGRELTFVDGFGFFEGLSKDTIRTMVNEWAANAELIERIPSIEVAIKALRKMIQ